MKYLLPMMLLLILSGCAVATPNFYKGRYYMYGDSSCSQPRELSDSRIICYDSAGRQTGYRDAMTDQQIEMYMNERRIENSNAYKYTAPVNCYTFLGRTTCY